ncbi:MAG TPA: glutaredoxin family protein [Dokdonella sp.]|jgi:glutaredoxin|nr:glutaredoxin family protein [Dokdonella sp.]
MINRLLLALTLVVSAWMLLGLSGSTDAVARDEANPTLEVVMYTTKSCPYCIKAREWFASRNVQWEERDIETSAEARSQWKELGGAGTPLVLINGKRFAGFSPAAFEAELARYR